MPQQPQIPPLFKRPDFWKGALTCAAVVGVGAVLWTLLLQDNDAEEPPADVKDKAAKAIPKTFAALRLPDYIVNHCQSRFIDGYFADAVLRAFHALEEHMRQRLKLFDPEKAIQVDCKRLAKAVWGNNGNVEVAKVLVHSQNTTEQELAWETHSWLVDFVRTPNAHAIIDKDEKDCLAHLHEIAFVAQQFDAATTQK